MGIPKTPGCPYHCDTGLLPQKGKRDLNGEQICTVVVVVVVVVFIPTEIKEVYSSNCCPTTCYLSKISRNPRLTLTGMLNLPLVRHKRN